VSPSRARSTSFKLTSGSESASESAQGYTSASGSESTTGLGLGFRIRTRSGQNDQGIGTDNSSTSRAASVRVGVLRASNALAGSKATSPSPKSQYPPVSNRTEPASRSSLERMGSSRPVQPSQPSSVKRASPPIQGTTSKPPSEGLPRRQTEPATTPSSTKHSSWLVIPKPAHSSANSSGPSGGQESKVPVSRLSLNDVNSKAHTLGQAPSKLQARATQQASSTSGASAQAITATQALTVTSPLNLMKSPSTPIVLGTGSPLSVSATASTVRSLPALPSTSGNTRRTNNERTTGKDKTKDSTWPARSSSKRSLPPGSSLPVQSQISSGSPPYAPPSSFSASTTAPTVPSISTPASPQLPSSRVVVPIRPTQANIFALQTENAGLRSEIASLREQARRREQEIHGLRWPVINGGGDKKDTLGFTTTTERCPSGDNAESREEVQPVVRYLCANSESGYGSGSASASHSRLSHSSTYSSVYPAESVSDGSNSEVGIAQRFGPGPSARASEDNALDSIPKRTVAGGEDTAAAEAERRQKRDKWRASRALKRLSASMTSDATGSGLDEVVSQGGLANNLAHGRKQSQSIDQVIEGDRTRCERVGLKGMDKVLDKLRAAGVDSGAAGRVKK